MAKTITDEEILLSVKVNGDAAQKELLDLDNATRKLNKSNDELRAKRKELAAQGKKDTQEYRRLSQEIKANSQTIAQNKNRMSELQKQIGVTGLTVAQLRSRATQLRATLSNLIPGSADYQRYNAELQKVNARLTELRVNGQAASFSIGKIADGFNRYAALGASAIATLAGFTLTVQKFLDYNGKLADSQSDVMKTTGMTRQEVDELTKSFGVFKTRTARIELLALATEAGRLGIEGVDNVQAFVKEMDKMKVALGDDLSDEAIREVGKMVQVYKVGEATGRDFAGAMNALGSSINEVSASGANQAGFLVDYLKRQAGIAAQAKLSAADNVGYAATFDEIGQSVEVSATAMNKVWMDMFTNSATYAKIAGMNVKDFSELLQTDANEAMIRFLEGLNGNNEGLQIMLQRLDGLEVGGARGVQAISALAGSTELLRKRQLTSNQALQEATSLTDEFNLKNSNLQAVLERIQKTIVGVFASETVVEWLEKAVSWFAKFIGAVEDTDGSVGRLRDRLIFLLKVLIVLTASFFSYKIALQLATIWTRTLTTAKILYTAAANRAAIITGILRSGQLLLAAAYAFATGNTNRATAAMRLFNATAMSNPLGLFLGLLAAVVTGFVLFRKRVDEASATLKMLKDVELEATQAIQKQKSEVDLLVKAINSENTSKERKIQLLKQLNAISPEYLGNLTLENIATAEGKRMLDLYTESLYKNARAKAAQAKFDELARKRLEAESKSSKDISTTGKSIARFFFQSEGPDFKNRQDVEKYVRETFKNIDDKMFNTLVEKYIKSSGLYKKEAELALIDAQMKELEKELLKATSEGFNPTINPDAPVTPLSPNNDKSKTKYDDSYLDNERRLMEELRKLRQKTQNEYFQTLEDNYRKEIQLQELKHEHLVDDLQAEYNAKAFLIQQIDKDIDAATKAGDTKKVQSLKNSKALIQDMQTEINAQIQHAERSHFNELGKIQAKYGDIIIANLDEHYKREREVRQAALDNELARTDLSNKDRTRKRREFERQEIEHEKKYLEEKLQAIAQIIQNTEIEGIEFELLSEEQKNKLQAEYEFLSKILDALRNPGKAVEKDLGLGQTDILGFTQDQWNTFFENIQNGAIGIQTIGMAVQAAQNLWGEFNAYLTASENASLRNYERNQDARKRALKKQLDNGYINQAQYKQRMEQIDLDLERKKAEIEYRQAKRQRVMALAQIASNTAQAIMAIWARFTDPVSVGVLTGIAAVTGALQAATVMKQPLPARGFEDGYYPVRREQDGKIFNAAYGGMSRSGMVRKPTVFLAGEGGQNFPEMIIDGKSYKNFSPGLKDLLQRELRGVRGFEQGYYDNQGRFTIPADNTSSSEPDPILGMVLKLMNKNIEVLEQIQNDGVIGKFLPSDYESMRNLKKAEKRYQDLIEKNRKS